MPRPRTVSMRTTNLLLDEAGRGFGGSGAVPSESILARRLGVSRTAVRAALARLGDLGVISGDRRGLIVRRAPTPADYYRPDKVESRSDLVARRFMEMAMDGALQPGNRFSEAELARRVGVSTVSVREFLISFSRYGLVEKEPRGGWRLGAFDQAFGQELAAIRRIFEVDAIRRFASLGANDEAWRMIGALLRRHADIRRNHTQQPRLFSELDREFHRFLVERLGNRFANSFYDIISFVFHYHYQWDRRDEAARNARALDEHEAVLRALVARDFIAAERLLDQHLATSVQTLQACLSSPHRTGSPHADTNRRDVADSGLAPLRADSV